jgi:TRAP-type C4-dicarboxylate transport system permease small subunit
MSLALSTPVYVVFAALLVFGAAVVLQFMFRLIRDAKHVAGRAREAGEQLRESAAALEEQSRKASERAAALNRPPRRHAR